MENGVSDPHGSGGSDSPDFCNVCLVYHKQAGFHQYGICPDRDRVFDTGDQQQRRQRFSKSEQRTDHAGQ